MHEQSPASSGSSSKASIDLRDTGAGETVTLTGSCTVLGVGWADDVIALLSPYRQLDVVRDLAALQLLPSNGDFLFRLQTLTALAASDHLPEASDASPHDKWSQWLNNSPMSTSATAAFEDAQDNIFCDEIRFFGGSYKVLPGMVSDATFIVRSLTGALFLLEPLSWASTFQNEVAALIQTTLRISNHVCKRAGLLRGAMPVASESLVAPPQAQFDQLRTAVWFSEAELEELLTNDSIEALDPISADWRAVDARKTPPWSSSLPARPLLRFDEGLLVASPCQLLASVRHAVVNAAKRHGVLAELAERWRESIQGEVEDSIELFQIPLLKRSVVTSSRFDVSLFGLDSDKALCVYLVTDDLSEYPSDDVYSPWSGSPDAAEFDECVREVEQVLLLKPTAPNYLLHLLVTQALGRPFGVGFGARLEPLKALRQLTTAADLEVISKIEHKDPLALLKYARSSDAIRNTTQVIAPSLLDEFALYLKHDHSYYFTDDERPDLISVVAGHALELRSKARDELDLHGAMHYSEEANVEVALTNGNSGIPIYFPWKLTDREPAQLVELPGYEIWVVGERIPGLTRISLAVVDMVAYWLWQLLDEYAGETFVEPVRMTIRVVTQPGEGWLEEVGDAAGFPVIGLDLAGGNQPEIHVPESLSTALHSETNEGERLVVWNLAHLLKARIEHLALPDPDVATDHVAPLGRKKKLVLVSTGSNVQLSQNPDLPSARLLHGADVATVLDDVGEQLAARRGVGPIPDDDRVAVMNQFVADTFSDLEVCLRRLAPARLLETLVALNESLLRFDALRTLLIPTRLLCFPLEQEVITDLVKEGPQRVTSAVASRFLIEYVTSTPPTGFRPISLDIYDRALALGTEIVTKGMMSDAIQYGGADYQLSVLPSRRLGINKEGRYESGRVSFLPVFAKAEIGQAQSEFSAHWREERAGERPEVLDWLDEGSKCEFGVSVSDIVNFLFAVIEAGGSQESAAKKMSEKQLLDQLEADLGWDRGVVEATFDIFSLAPRGNYLSPPPPFCNSDVYPWKFNRELSYVRRPLLIRHAPTGREVIWGSRNVEMTAKNFLMSLCYGGRLKARSLEMKQVMQRIRQLEARDFEARVADTFKNRDPSLEVRPRVWSVNGVPIEAGPGKTLGDIDALVADRENRILMLAEAKDLALARTPIELARELEETFGTAPGSAANKHLKRTRWIKDRLPMVLSWLGIEDQQISRWVVQPLIVVDDVTMSPFVAQCPIPIRRLQEVDALLDGRALGNLLHDIKWN